MPPVSTWYADFDQVDDDKVVRVLSERRNFRLTMGRPPRGGEPGGGSWRVRS